MTLMSLKTVNQASESLSDPDPEPSISASGRHGGRRRSGRIFCAPVVDVWANHNPCLHWSIWLYGAYASHD